MIGGASRARTDDLIVANDALSQLSYSPIWRRVYLLILTAVARFRLCTRDFAAVPAARSGTLKTSIIGILSSRSGVYLKSKAII